MRFKYTKTPFLILEVRRSGVKEKDGRDDLVKLAESLKGAITNNNGIDYPVFGVHADG